MTIESPGLGHRFPALDSLRAVGALAVLVTHVGFSSGAYDDAGALGRLVARMDVGVAIFFVLSGFLLSRPWLVRARDGLDPPDAWSYLRKRFWRIYPAYAVVTLLALATLPENDDLGPGRWLVALLMGDIYVSEQLPTGITQTWSLATEVAFYVALPPLMALAAGRRLHPRRVLLVLVGLAALNVAWLLELSARIPGVGVHVNEWLPAFLTWFSVGILVALVHTVPDRLPRLDGALRGLAGSPGSCWLLALGLLLVAGTPVAGPTALIPATTGEAVTKNVVYALVGLCLLLPGVFPLEGGRLDRFMCHRVPRRLGLISYSLFLTHMFVLELVMRFGDFTLFAGNFWPILLLTLSFSIAASELLYRLVERPFLRRKAAVAPSGSSASASTAETPSTTR